MKYAKMVLETPPTAKWYIRVILFFTFFRVLPKWVGDKNMAKKYLYIKSKKSPSGVRIDLK